MLSHLLQLELLDEESSKEVGLVGGLVEHKEVVDDGHLLAAEHNEQSQIDHPQNRKINNGCKYESRPAEASLLVTELQVGRLVAISYGLMKFVDVFFLFDQELVGPEVKTYKGSKSH